MSKLRSVLKRKNLACHGYGIIERIIGQALRFRKTNHIAERSAASLSTEPKPNIPLTQATITPATMAIVQKRPPS